MGSLVFDSTFHEYLYRLSTKSIVVIDRPWSSITPAERTLLQKILTAIQLSVDAVIILESHQLNGAEIPVGQRLISFGWKEGGASLFEPQPWGKGQIVFSESLEQLIMNDESKKRLWQGLKKLFTA